MANLDDLFATPKAYDHPKLRSWRSYRDSRDTKESCIEFRRKRDGLSYQPARIYFEAKRNDGTIFTDMEPWDDDLNLALVQNAFKARDERNESDRFGFMLESMLEPLQIHFGDGFFNAALNHYLKENGYSKQAKIAEKLAKITEHNVSLGRSFADFKDRLEGVLAECVRYLGNLGYPASNGKEILTAAIAYYLDDRYSITNRALLGW